MSTLSTWILQTVMVTVVFSPGYDGYANHPCGTTVNATAEVTTLVSPGYPRDYANNLDCVYHIAAQEGENVLLSTSTIDGIRMEESEFCHKDYIHVINGQSVNGNILTKTCGISNVQVLSDGRFMTIFFHSDSEITGRGFRFEYRAINQSEKVPKQMLDVSDTKYSITSPRYPDNYPLNTDREWFLSAPKGYVVYLEFGTSDLENSQDCQKDFIRISDTFHSDGGTLGRFCGMNHPSKVQSSGIFMNLFFHSDNTTTGRGFQAFYSARPKPTSEAVIHTTNVILILATIVTVTAFIWK